MEVGTADHAIGQLNVVLIVGIVNVCNTDFTKLWIEQVGPVARAAHPTFHHPLWGVEACGDILACKEPVDIARCKDPVTQSGSFRTPVTEVVTVSHVLRVPAGCRIQVWVTFQRGNTA